MKSAPRGKSTSVEVGNVTARGFWLLVGERELYLSFDKFPWFRNAPVGQLVHVTVPHSGHLYWPDLDVDLAVESIEHPERYPLVSRRGASNIREARPATKTKKRASPRRRKS